MYDIIDEISFDFSKMFMNYLSEAISQTKMNVPYGMAFTKIFIESGVRILLDEPKKVLKYVDFYTLGTLTRMGFKKEEEKWIRKIIPDPLPSNFPPPPAPRTSASPPPSTPISLLPRAPSPPLTDTQTLLEPQPSTSPLKHAKELISSHFDTITSQLQTIQSQNSELKAKLQDLKTQNLDFKNQVCSVVPSGVYVVVIGTNIGAFVSCTNEGLKKI